MSVPASSTRGRLLRALGAGGFAQAINVMTQLVSVPLFLRFWGPGRYGEWLILSTVPSYLLMSDVGFVSAAANEMAMRAARGDRDGALAVFQSISWLVLGICSVLAVVLVPAVWVLPVDAWLGVHQFTPSQVRWSICLFMAHVTMGMLNGVVFFAFRCDGRYPLGAVCSDAARLVEFVALAVAVAVSRSPVVVVAVNASARVLTSWAMRRVLWRVSPWLRYGVDRTSVAEIRRLAAPAVAFLGFPLGSALTLQGMVLVVGRVLGPVQVVGFTTVRTLCNVVQQALNVLNATVGPEMSLAYGAGNLELARRLHRLSCRVAAWVGLSAAVGLGTFGPWMLHVWTGRQIEINTALLYLMLVVMVSRSFWYTSCVVPMATNRHKEVAIWFCCGSVLSIGAAVLAMRAFGLPGAAAGLLVNEVIMNAVVVRQSMRLLHDHLGDFLRSLARPPTPSQVIPRRRRQQRVAEPAR